MAKQNPDEITHTDISKEKSKNSHLKDNQHSTRTERGLKSDQGNQGKRREAMGLEVL